MLLRWSESPPEHTLAEGDYWEFSTKGLSHRLHSPACTHRPRTSRVDAAVGQLAERRNREVSGQDATLLSR